MPTFSLEALDGAYSPTMEISARRILCLALPFAVCVSHVSMGSSPSCHILPDLKHLVSSIFRGSQPLAQKKVDPSRRCKKSISVVPGSDLLQDATFPTRFQQLYTHIYICIYMHITHTHIYIYIYTSYDYICIHQARSPIACLAISGACCGCGLPLQFKQSRVLSTRPVMRLDTA